MSNRALICTLERLYREGGVPDAATRQALAAFLTTVTPGPWRWGDWSATFGSVEDPDHRLTLESALSAPVAEAIVADHARYPKRILDVEQEVDNFSDKDFLVIARMAVPLLLRALGDAPQETAAPPSVTARFDPARPVRTRHGRPARIVCTDARRGRFSVLALVEVDGLEEPRFFDEGGRSVDGVADLDLVNA